MKGVQNIPALSTLKLGNIAINQATTRSRWAHKESLQGYARHGLHHVNLWRDKIQELGIVETRKLISQLNLNVIGLNRIGPVFLDNGKPNLQFLDDAKRGIEEAFELDADNLMYFPGTALPTKTDLDFTRKYSEECLFEILQIAREAGVLMVLEPLHPMIAGDRSCINTMQQCNNICDVMGSGLGIIVDVYHVWWDPALHSEINRAGPDRLSGFQINDWLVPTRDFLNDRGMVGDGIIELKKIRGWMEQAGYKGPVEVELFSDHWWRQDPDHVVELAIERTLALA